MQKKTLVGSLKSSKKPRAAAAPATNDGTSARKAVRKARKAFIRIHIKDS